MLRFVGLLVAVLLSCAPAAASMRHAHFMVMWAYEGPGNRLEDAHTFASFYRGIELERGIVRPLTISWLPVSGVVRGAGRERGRNFSLTETLAIARSRGYRIASSGPFKIAPELYRRAYVQFLRLTSGRWSYSMLNLHSNAKNCIAAVGEIGGGTHTFLAYGFDASRILLRDFSRWMPNYPYVDQQAAQVLYVSGDLVQAKNRRGGSHY